MHKTIPRRIVIPLLFWELVVDKIEWHDGFGFGNEWFLKIQWSKFWNRRKSATQQLDKLARYLINNHGDIIKVDDLPMNMIIDEAIKVMQAPKPPHPDCFHHGGCGCNNIRLNVKPRTT